MYGGSATHKAPPPKKVISKKKAFSILDKPAARAELLASLKKFNDQIQKIRDSLPDATSSNTDDQPGTSAKSANCANPPPKRGPKMVDRYLPPRANRAKSRADQDDEDFAKMLDEMDKIDLE
ncbi:hypothetical protein AAVH_03429 [Aphelenchoides avenae]|nr:hypothetical protein AAVH_03429 [Aphelenchus avenae]